MKQISPHIFQISLGAVNAFLVEDKGLTLIDTGLPGSMEKIFEAIRKAGKDPEQIRQVILTHLHTDHTGSAAAIKKTLNIPFYAHETDARLIEQGIAGRPVKLSPGIINRIVYNLFIKNAGSVISSVKIEEKLKDNDLIPVAGGLQVIHTPGHSAGHISLLAREEGVLIAGDICANFFKPAYSTVYEDLEQGRLSILKAAGFRFDKAVFGHGNMLKKDADKKLMKSFL